MSASALTELFDLVMNVPSGRCTSYGALGSALTNRVSGLIVGKWMERCPADTPWWRVVGSKGDLLTARRDPHLAAQQRELLKQEGVPFVEDRVDMAAVFWPPL